MSSISLWCTSFESYLVLKRSNFAWKERRQQKIFCARKSIAICRLPFIVKLSKLSLGSKHDFDASWRLLDAALKVNFCMCLFFFMFMQSQFRQRQFIRRSSFRRLPKAMSSRVQKNVEEGMPSFELSEAHFLFGRRRTSNSSIAQLLSECAERSSWCSRDTVAVQSPKSLKNS